MTQPLAGKCLCGASEFSAAGDVKFAIRCYCTDCQQFSGSGSLPQFAVPHEGFSHTGSIVAHSRPSESGHTLGFHFCGNCGSSLFKSSTRAADIVFVCAGVVTNPPDSPEFRNVFETSRRDWDHP